VREMVSLLKNELTSMVEKNHRTKERNRHLEDKVMIYSEQLSGVQNTLNEFIRSQQALDLALDLTHPLLCALNIIIAPRLIPSSSSPSTQMPMMMMMVVIMMTMGLIQVVGILGMIRNITITISTIRAYKNCLC